MCIKRIFTRCITSFHHMPIRHKLIVLIVGACFISIGITTIAFTFFGIMNMKRDIIEETTILAQVIGDKNAAALSFNNPEVVKANLEVLALQPSIRNACIYDKQANIFAVYSTDENIDCPPFEKEGQVVLGHTLRLFHTITKKNHELGYIFMESNLERVSSYISKQLLTAGIVFTIACGIAYLLALRLQRTISSPIIQLVQDTRQIATTDDYSIRADKHYWNELGEIVDIFNMLLEKRQHKYQKISEQQQILFSAFQQSKHTLDVLGKEVMFPYRAAETFKMLLETRAFGPVHASYLEYFNDVYTAEVDMYQMLTQAIDIMKLQTEMQEKEREEIEIGRLLEEIIDYQLVKLGGEQVKYIANSHNIPAIFVHKKIYKRLFLLIFSLIKEQQGTRKKPVTIKYDCYQDDQYLHVVIDFSEKNCCVYSNDNYYQTSLEDFIGSLRNNEECMANYEKGPIEFKEMPVRGKLYLIRFISDIMGGKTFIKLSQDNVIFDVAIPCKVSTVMLYSEGSR